MSQAQDVTLTESPLGGPLPTGTGVTLGDGTAKQYRSLWSNAWRQFRMHRLAVAGLVVIVFITVACFVGTMIYPRGIDDIDFLMTSASPSSTYPFGTDALGQDILARILWGGRISLSVGFLSALVAISVGTLVGASAGFFGGATDGFLMRLTDLFICLPQLPLLLLISFLYREKVYRWADAQFGDGNIGIFLLIILVIAVLNWMSTARLVRAEFLRLKEKEFVEAARSIGARQTTLMFKHILPNVLSQIIVAATLSVGAAIITESTLSFLGLGFPSDVPTWGRMLFEAQSYFQFYPYQALFPGMVIFLTVLSINYIGDGLRDALDPRKTR
ncbi:MAG: ABC transporter permease [Thermomicrobiales bacterium]|nr:ABC transporter permease [Thermomicrobiales bacterium]MCO5220528.1 ABC transporter permease [Thermomicrobiales bacterium]